MDLNCQIVVKLVHQFKEMNKLRPRTGAEINAQAEIEIDLEPDIPLIPALFSEPFQIGAWISIKAVGPNDV